METQGWYHVRSRTRPNTRSRPTLLTRHINRPSSRAPRRHLQMSGDQRASPRTSESIDGEGKIHRRRPLKDAGCTHTRARTQRQYITPPLPADPPSIITVPRQVKDPFPQWKQVWDTGSHLFHYHISNSHFHNMWPP